MSDRPPALFSMDPMHLNRLFPAPLMRRLADVLDIRPDLVVERLDDPAAAEALAEAEVIISGWGAPRIDAAGLARAPRLRTVLHTAGSVKHLIAPEAWERGITVSSAVDANAVPVAEYTLGAILLAGKGMFELRERFRAERGFLHGAVHPGVGNFGRVVGIIGASRIGRKVIALLRPFDFEVLLADPYVDAAEAAKLGVGLVELDDLMQRSDVVSVHAPDLEETRNLLDTSRLAMLKDGAVVINTARGRLVDTEALSTEASTGRISAIIDVTHPEPLPPASALFDLPNIFLTPHVAGSQGNELARMGKYIVEEAERLAAGKPLARRIDPELLWRQA